MSNAKGIKFAIDVPSGVYCDSGYNDPGCFKADYTIAISALKPAHIMHPASECCGDIIIANIGIPEESYKLVSIDQHLFPSIFRPVVAANLLAYVIIGYSNYPVLFTNIKVVKHDVKWMNFLRKLS